MPKNSSQDTYKTQENEFVAYLIKQGALPLDSVSHTASGKQEFCFSDPHSHGNVLYQQYRENREPVFDTSVGCILPNGFVETITSGEYLVRNGDETRIQSSWANDKVICRPPDNKLVKDGVVILPDTLQPYGSVEELVRALKCFIHAYIDTTPFWVDLLAHYVLLTWAYDAFQSVPYLRFIGEYGTGKTRYLEVMKLLCYRSTLVSGATSNAAVFRLLNMWRGTFLFDEADFSSDEFSEIVKILNNGYRQGAPVLRADGGGSREFMPTSYYVFGPKILATRNRFKDDALESRCLTFETSEKTLRSDIPNDLPAKAFHDACNLRNKLLQWRFDSFRNLAQSDSRVRMYDARLQQITWPLYAIAPSQTFRDALMDFVTEYQKRDKPHRPQALVLEAIELYRCEASNTEPVLTIPIKTIVENVQKIAIDQGLVTKQDFKPHMSARRVGSLLKSLGFSNKTRTKEGYVVRIGAKMYQQKRVHYALADDEPQR